LVYSQTYYDLIQYNYSFGSNKKQRAVVVVIV